MLLTANLNQQPWNSTFPTLILLKKCKSLSDINQIHARLLTTGFIKNTFLTTKIILSFSTSLQAPLIEFARYIFFRHHAFEFNEKEEEEKDPFLWNALWLVSLMLENGAFADKFTLSLVLKACSRAGLVKEGMQIHGLLKKLEFGSDLFLQNCLISLYVKCGCLVDARLLFDRMPKRDSVTYNSMIDGYVKGGRIDLARAVFDCIPLEERNLISWNSLISGYAQFEDGISVAWQLFEKMPERDLISWNSMIDGCVKCGRMEDAQALFDTMPNRDIVSWANMIDGYAKNGSVDIARCFFDEMPERDVVACNAMMGGYLQNGYCTQALGIFYGMQSDGNFSPDNATLLIALSAIAQLGHIEKGIAIHCYIEEIGFSLDGRLGVALIDMYSKCGSIENAMMLFENIKEKSVDHWNAIIGGLAIHGLGELAFDFLMEMKRMRVEPDDITFIGILHACGHAGLKSLQVEPKLQHYGCMVDILGRAGHIEEAKHFVQEMPVEPNDVIWRSLLSACKTHESFNVGQPVAENLIRLDSPSPSSYVLVSNMYAGLGKWSDVRKVRAMMKGKNLKKIPGCSWIELEGPVHAFFELHVQVVFTSLIGSTSRSRSILA
ncbi:pentatricopeptide repeat-containing family protein [Salix suchowensis]|nr:pentatricopeptide repeat-containing family protein [Salix suchowensis]